MVPGLDEKNFDFFSFLFAGGDQGSEIAPKRQK
jgi:hypothetical protein